MNNLILLINQLLPQTFRNYTELCQQEIAKYNYCNKFPTTFRSGYEISCIRFRNLILPALDIVLDPTLIKKLLVKSFSG
jgi:hypothetical protein